MQLQEELLQAFGALGVDKAQEDRKTPPINDVSTWHYFELSYDHSTVIDCNFLFSSLEATKEKGGKKEQKEGSEAYRGKHPEGAISFALPNQRQADNI